MRKEMEHLFGKKEEDFIRNGDAADVWVYLRKFYPADTGSMTAESEMALLERKNLDLLELYVEGHRFCTEEAEKKLIALGNRHLMMIYTDKPLSDESIMRFFALKDKEIIRQMVRYYIPPEAQEMLLEMEDKNLFKAHLIHLVLFRHSQLSPTMEEKIQKHEDKSVQRMYNMLLRVKKRG